MSKYLKIRKVLQDSLFKRFLESQVCVVGTNFHMKKDSYTQILYVTKNASSVIQHDRDELLESTLNKLYPDLVNGIHRDFLRASLSFSHKKVHSELQTSYLKT